MPKYLIIRFSSIGDIVLTTPVIRCIKEQLNCEVHFLTKEAFKPVLLSNPYIDKIYTIKESAKPVISYLEAEKYDGIIDLHHNLRSLYIKSRIKSPAFSFRKLNIEKWMMVNLKVNRLPALHIVDRYFETVSMLGVVNDKKGLDYFIPNGESVEINMLPQDLQNGYVGFVIGAKHFTKTFPVSKAASVCSMLSTPVVLLGGKEDAVRADKIIALARNINPTGVYIYNACGRYSLNQSASLVEQADAIITNDTGLMHIAAAFNKKILSLWGNTIPEFGMYPYAVDDNSASTIFEIKGLYCRPCSKIGYDKCPQKHFRCMNDLSEIEIANTVNSYINRKA